jgi:soluble lytic murein transglycosylase-like protein
MVCWAGNLPNQPATRAVSVVRTDVRTGKLVRTMVVTAQPQRTLSQTANTSAPAVQPASALTSAVEQIAAEHSLPPELIHSVIQVESNYNPFAISPKGARGIMQLVPATARRFGVTDSFNPVDNIRGGARYLKYLLDLYHGNYPLALAAYNAGEEAVARYGGVPPFPETQNYVIEVGKRLDNARKASAANKPHEDPAPAAVDPDAPTHVQLIVEPGGRVRYVSR